MALLGLAWLWTENPLLLAQETVRAGVTGKPDAERLFTFDNATPNEIPPGFFQALTAGGGPVKWQVIEAEGAPSGNYVVAQLSKDATNTRFPLLVLDDFSAQDVDISVKFKAVSGEVDRAAGIVWRLQDKDNYYITRTNALENNVVIYKTVGGKRSNIGIKGDPKAYGVKAEVLANKWNTLRVRMVGERAEVFLNGALVLEVENDTFQGPGKIGFWTKADSVTYFDDLCVQVVE